MVYVYVLSGDTWKHRQAVKELGFYWHGKERVWWRPLAVNNAAENEQTKKAVRQLVGVTLTTESGARYGMGRVLETARARPGV